MSRSMLTGCTQTQLKVCVSRTYLLLSRRTDEDADAEAGSS